MRVYLSARFERQNEMQRYSEQLRTEGIEVVSAWHELDSPSSDGFSGIARERRAWLAMMDVQQLVGSNVLVSFSDADSLDPRGGKHVETGIALALGKRLLLVGSAENIFHSLPDVEQFPSWSECFVRILELRETDVLSTRQAAEEAGVTNHDIVRWIRSGKLLAAKRYGRYAIPRNDLDLVKARRRREVADRASKGASNVDTRTD
jgi:nucleoside 2-deoxyribosyltransferase